MSALLFLDTETTGVELDADVWELAAIRRQPDGGELSLRMFVQHDRAKCQRLPEPFLSDHAARYVPDEALSLAEAGKRLGLLLGDRPHLVGAVPDFDAIRLEPMLRAAHIADRWHYHLIDVETLAVGYLMNSGGQFTSWHDPRPPWDSNALSAAVGVDPARFARHTAMGDAEWARAIYDAIMGGAPRA